MKYKKLTPLRLFLGMLIFLPLFALLLALQTGKIKNLMVISESMEPTLNIGDRVLMARSSHYLPVRGDVVVLTDPDHVGDLMTKRVVAVSGDVIRIVNGYLFVNGHPEPLQTFQEQSVRIHWPNCVIYVPPGGVFVMGDNRNRSYDSLNFGPVPVQEIQGKLKYRYWPLERFGEIQ